MKKINFNEMSKVNGGANIVAWIGGACTVVAANTYWSWAAGPAVWVADGFCLGAAAGAGLSSIVNNW